MCVCVCVCIGVGGGGQRGQMPPQLSGVPFFRAVATYVSVSMHHANYSTFICFGQKENFDLPLLTFPLRLCVCVCVCVNEVLRNYCSLITIDSKMLKFGKTSIISKGVCIIDVWLVKSFTFSSFGRMLQKLMW
jgi:hypothetical protein